MGWGAKVLELTDGEKIARVVDVEFGANLSEILECIAVNGIIATYSSTVVKQPELPFLRMMYMDLTVRMIIVYAMPESAKRQAMNDINRALENDLLKHRIAKLLPLEKLAQSHQMIESAGIRGCVVVSNR